MLAAAAATVLVAAIGLVGLVWVASGARSSAAVVPATATAAPPGLAPQAPDPAPDPCAATLPLLQLVTEQQGQAKYLLAATNAETGLARPDVCPAHREQLARQAVAGRLQALWSESVRPDDRDAQQRAVDLYRQAADLADRYGISGMQPSPQMAADRAYQSGQFLLVKQLLDPMLERTPAAADRALLRRYYAALRNLGVGLGGAASAGARDEGLSLLVAAHLIDERYHLEQGEATRDLVAALGPDRAHWPAPATTPLLAPTDRAAA